MLNEENWKSHPILTDLEVSDLGRIRTTKGVYLRPRDNGKGYWNVNRKNRTHYVHRLVAETFYGLYGHLQVNHLDGDKANNRLENLEFVDAPTNMRHAVALDLSDQRFKEQELLAMRFMRDCGMTFEQIGEQFDCLRGIVYNALKRTNAAPGFGRKYD